MEVCGPEVFEHNLCPKQWPNYTKGSRMEKKKKGELKTWSRHSLYTEKEKQNVI